MCTICAGHLSFSFVSGAGPAPTSRLTLARPSDTAPGRDASDRWSRSSRQSCGPLADRRERASLRQRTQPQRRRRLTEPQSRAGDHGVVSHRRGPLRESSLADVLPSALAALGVAGERNVLAIEPAECVVVLLVDGLGWQLLRAAQRRGAASYRASPLGRSRPDFRRRRREPHLARVRACRRAEHGITGYTTRANGLTEPVNWLTWRGAYSGRDLTEEQPPERVQPEDTAFERAARAGVSATVVSSPMFRDSGLTERRFEAGTTSLRSPPRTPRRWSATRPGHRRGLVYCYSSELDLIGHVRGTRSDAWLAQLELIDRGVRMLSDRLPPVPVCSSPAITACSTSLKKQRSTMTASRSSRRESTSWLANPGHVTCTLRKANSTPCARAGRGRSGIGSSSLPATEAISRGWFGPVVSEQARGPDRRPDRARRI